MREHTKKITCAAILPNYNSSEFLSGSLTSLVTQSTPFDEIIIVDDGSTDDSLTVIAAFASKYSNIKLIKLSRNQGVCAALNHGLQAATSDYVILCAADDLYQRHIVFKAKQIIAEHPSIGLVCGDAIVKRHDTSGEFCRTLPFPKNKKLTAEAFQAIAKRAFVCFNGSGGMFMNRLAMLEAGMLYAELRWHCDWLLYMLVAWRYGIYYVDEVFIHINVRQHSYSMGKAVWREQKQVLLALMQILKEKHSAQFLGFRNAALLPSYAPRYIPLFMFNRQLRSYLTKQLVWKMFMHNQLTIKIARKSPYPIVMKIRKLLRA